MIRKKRLKRAKKHDARLLKKALAAAPTSDKK